MTLSVLYPLQPTDPRQVAPFAALAGRFPGARLWTGQSLRLDAYALFAHLAGAGLRVPFGISVGLVPMRHPLEAALQARSLAALTGMPVVAGFGTATPGFVAAVRGAPYDRPGSAAAEYAQTVRTALAGGPVDHAGPTQVLRTGLPTLDTPPVEVGLGVLRPRMARLAAAAADVVITWMTPPAYVRDHLVPALEAGTPAGRARPRIVTVVPMALRVAGHDPLRLAETGSAAHLAGPHYADMLHRAGVYYERGDIRGGARAIVDAGVFLTGSAEEVVDAIAEHHRAGVDEVVLNPAGLLTQHGPAVTLGELETVLTAAHATTCAPARAS